MPKCTCQKCSHQFENSETAEGATFTGLPFEKDKWISNPYCFGAIGYYPEGKSVGSVLDLNGRVRGWFHGELVYNGDDADEAFKTIQQKWSVESRSTGGAK